MRCFPKLLPTLSRSTSKASEEISSSQEALPSIEKCSVQSTNHSDIYKPVQVFVQAKRSTAQKTSAEDPQDAQDDPQSRATRSIGSGVPADTITKTSTQKSDKSEQANLDGLSLSNIDARLFSSPSMPSKWKKADSIGSGSFGTVHLGLNSDTGELMAIKEVLLAADGSRSKEAVEQLEREVALLSTLSHPNIVQYLGTIRDGNSLLIFLEYVPGGSISSLISRFGPLHEDVVRVYIRQLLLGLAYLHAQRTIHRDVKGANLLVEKNGRVKLADFGMAKQMVEHASFTKSFKGSAFWMAPEVIRQQGHGVAADIWSVGCTLLEMATGKPPWSQCSTQVQAIFKIASSQELPSIPESLSPEASEFTLLCLQRDPATRPTAEELLRHPFVSLSSRAIPSALHPADYVAAAMQHTTRTASVTSGVGAGAGDVESSGGKSGGKEGGMGRVESVTTGAGGGGRISELGQQGSDKLAAMLLGSTSMTTTRKRGSGSENTVASADDVIPGLPLGYPLSSQPQMFSVRGLLTLPPLKVLAGQQLPPALFGPLPPSREMSTRLDLEGPGKGKH